MVRTPNSAAEMPGPRGKDKQPLTPLAKGLLARLRAQASRL